MQNDSLHDSINKNKSQANMGKLIHLLVVLTTVLSVCSGSAIPMWEFLGRTEKMSHLYSMFAKEVSKYCKANGESSITKCKHDLLAFGVTKLEKMNESHLDAMDPYQRSANDIIWDAIMDDHPMMQSKKQQTTKARIRQPTGIFEHNPLFDGMDDTENPSKDDRKQIDDGADMDAAYGNAYEEPGNHLPFATNIEYQYDLPNANTPSSNYLIGPMIVRVRPDGSPVDEDKSKPLPIDDDQMIIRSGYFQSPKQPSTRLEAPVAPMARASSARLMPNSPVYVEYQPITRQNQKN